MDFSIMGDYWFGGKNTLILPFLLFGRGNSLADF